MVPNVLINMGNNQVHENKGLTKQQGHIDKALKYYEKAIKNGHNGAKFHSNCMYRCGQHISFDENRSLEWSQWSKISFELYVSLWSAYQL